MLDIASSITLVGLVQGVFLLTLISLKKQKNQVAYFTMALLVTFLLDLSWYFVYLIGKLDQYWYLTGLDSIVLYVYGPVLYFYVKSHFNNHEAIPKMSLIKHFTPALLALLFTSPLFFRSIATSFLDNFKAIVPSTFAVYSLHGLLFDFLFWFAHVTVYLILTVHFIKSIKKDQNEYEKASKDQHLRWISILFIGYLIFPFIIAIDFFFTPFLPIDFNSYSLANVLMVFHVFVISYIGFTNQVLLLSPLKILKRPSTNLTKLDLQKLNIDLQALMQQQKLYLQPSLSLTQVAQQLQISPHQLSEFLNQETQQTFNDFVNTYRIQDAKMLLQQPQSQLLTIEAIAYEVGFNSPSTFYRYFNKFVGVTPSAWLKEQEIELAKEILKS